MKSIFIAVFVLICVPCIANAEYFRIADDGVYEIRVNDCSIESMQRVLNWATVTKRAMITTVKCDYKPAVHSAVITLVDKYTSYEQLRVWVEK